MADSHPEEGASGLSLTLGHLYPDQLNIYGDRGNIIVLRQRCRWRGIDLHVVSLDFADDLDPRGFDLLFIGGGQDKEQTEVARDLRERKGPALREMIDNGTPTLAVCGGYQLLARSYRPADGPELMGAGIFDAWTVHAGKAVVRCVGNIALEWDSQTLVGFENHGGRTYLGAGAQPLGRVLAGHGNNGEDGYEGCIYQKAYGTYLHGSLLPKNPHFADHLISLALVRKYGAEAAQLTAIDDRAEWQAHTAMLRRLGVAPHETPAAAAAAASRR